MNSLQKVHAITTAKSSPVFIEVNIVGTFFSFSTYSVIIYSGFVDTYSKKGAFKTKHCQLFNETVDKK